MFEVGDKVIVNSYTTPKDGVIVEWYYDEGNVWVVRVQDQTISTFCDSELTPANSIQPYNGNERYIYSDL